MDHPTGGMEDGSVRVGFDRRLKLEFHGAGSRRTPGCSPTGSWATLSG